MKIPTTDILVDEFSSNAEIYFLTHFHEDHMPGLERGWDKGEICCSSITARLLEGIKKVDSSRLITLDPGEQITFETPAGTVAVKAFEANHCPGAVMFLFETNGRRYLYTGDFRLDDGIRNCCREFAGVDCLFVDTTYAGDGYSFPPQHESIRSVVEIVRRNRDRNIFIAVYTIGKNRIVEEVFRATGQPVYLPPDKFRIYRLLGLEEAVTRDKDATNIRGYSRSYFDSYFKWTRHYRDRNAVVIIPTGWAVDDGEEKDPRYIYVPYSEHCDSRELSEFIRLIQPRRVVPI